MSDFIDENKAFPEPNSGCWLWMGAVTSKGYGHLWVDGKDVLAHRESYERKHGPIPPGLQGRHMCATRLCVNPDHIQPGTQSDNEADKRKQPGWTQPRPPPKLFCKNGHPRYGPDADVWIEKNGVRHCNRCRREHQRKR